ncbi:MAG TPA: sugar ABC transporter ATP-binding protein [Polyangiaceae bacterium]|nr:sugar ABC transporter ATP-binding protein [Polyangiaceae bacterium]HMR74321.1 sugar ABC transporter ATP-binding protein [Polyangiaceae bacterium]
MAGQVAARLTLEGVCKAFGPTRVLHEVGFEVGAGRVHAVIGENGAGKSTLMKIVAGALPADSGHMRLDGVPFLPHSTIAAREQGVAIVYQELSVCPDLTVAENILLGVEPTRFGLLQPQAIEERAQRALERVTGQRDRIAVHTLVADLSPAERQLVEIARAIAAESPKLLILDEPTSSLSAVDASRLLSTLRQLAAEGLSVLYISHFLEEVREVADDFTVLRDGCVVESGVIAATNNDALVQLMAGRAVTRAQRSARSVGEVVLQLTEVAGVRLPKQASLELRRGEVLGIAGLVGSGRTELLRAVFGLDAVLSGKLRVLSLTGSKAPSVRLSQGVGLTSEDRKQEGLALALSVRDNITLSKLEPFRRGGLLSERAERSAAAHWVERLGIRCRDVDQAAGELSGGNQQKVALARLLHHDVDVWLLDEPTRGIDVRSRGEIHALIDSLTGRGKAVLVVSSTLEELLEICDRIAVMRRGVLGPAHPVAELSEHALLAEAAGA